MHIASLVKNSVLAVLTHSFAGVGQVRLSGDMDLASPASESLVRRPVVLWHGLGDNYNSSGMNRVQQLLDQIYPEIYVKSVFIEEDPDKDQRRLLVGDANDEVQIVCNQLASDPHLRQGFDAIGFSQGGVLLRGLIERCPQVLVHTLVTFGSPHMGVLELPLCDKSDWLCQRRNALLKKQVWLDSVQKTIVPAQYFRDPLQFDKYITHLHYLADINNEKLDHFNATYAHNFKKLHQLVLVTFLQDTTLVPKDSARFGDVDVATGGSLPYDQTDLYVDDLIGLRSLDEEGKVKFHTIDDDHMRISDTFIVDIAIKYLGEFIE